MDVEKMPMGGVESSDEHGVEMEDPQQETFTFRLLFCPSGKNPTQMSGTIVYITTAIICEYSWRAGSYQTSTVHVANLVLSTVALLITILCIILANCLPGLLAGHASIVTPCTILFFLSIVCVVIIWRQPESKEALTFKVTIAAAEQRPCITLYDSLHFKGIVLPHAPNLHLLIFFPRCLLKVPLLPWLPLFSVFVNIYLMMQLDLGTWIRFTVWMIIGTNFD